MTAIREYPFDFSDLKRQESLGDSHRISKENSKPNEIHSKPNERNSKSHEQNSRLREHIYRLHEQILNNNMATTTNLELPPTSILCNVLDGDNRKISRERKVSNIERKVSIMANEQDKEKLANSESRNGRVPCHQAEGPSRRKSNLHNSLVTEIDTPWDRQTHIEGKYKKYSTTSTIYSKKALSYQSEHIERSWWYACCQKCHQEEAGIPSWEPPNWQKICPYPFCPSFRKVARLLTICVIGVLLWLMLWIIMGDTAAPGGQLFMLAVLTLAAHLGGWLVFKITTLPTLIGMLIVGVTLKNVGFVKFDTDYIHVVSYIRKISLTILLIRAGMDLDPHAMKKHLFTVIKLSLVPWTFEFVLCAVMAYYLLGLPWVWAFLLSSIIAAVSPAVIVPCLLRLRRKGYGVSKGIPTLVLAVSGIDDAASVAVFGIVFSIIFSTSSLTMTVIQGPLSVLIGIGVGVILGYFVKFVPEKNDAFLVPLRVLFLLFGGIVCMIGFEEIGWGGAGPLAVITFAFIACKNWSDLGWELEDNPAVTAFEIFWMFFEPMLFSVTGAQVEFDKEKLPLHLVLIGGGILIVCMLLRALLTSACAVRSNLNMKEKVFVGLAWMAKATVQAALGPVAYDQVEQTGGSPDSLKHAQVVVTLCILSIVLTAPIGAIVITFTGPRLLSRTTKPPILEGWRRSNRPSIRDISIIDEEELAERDAEIPQISLRPESPQQKESVIVTQPNHRSS